MSRFRVGGRRWWRGCPWRGAGEEGAVFVEAGFVVFVGVGEVEVPVVVAVVEFDGDGVVGVLVDGPDEADQVDAEVFAVATPGGAARLEGLVDARLPG